MIIQIYAIQSVHDALACIEAGADYIGFLPPQNRSDGIVMKDEISEEETKKILAITKGLATRVLLSVSGEPKTYFDIAEKYRPDVIHISSRTFTTGKEFYTKFKSLYPDIGILQAIPVTDESAVTLAEKLAPYADFLILDSVSTNKENGVGASGTEHDRRIDRRIIDSVSIPVIIAGGLDDKNIVCAMEETHPWGVDTMTRTNLPGSMDKDMDKVKAFCKKVREYENKK